MKDTNIEESLLRQGLLGAPVASASNLPVLGVGASSSYERLLGVLPAGTPDENATVVKVEDIVAEVQLREGSTPIEFSAREEHMVVSSEVLSNFSMKEDTRCAVPMEGVQSLSESSTVVHRPGKRKDRHQNNSGSDESVIEGPKSHKTRPNVMRSDSEDEDAKTEYEKTCSQAADKKKGNRSTKVGKKKWELTTNPRDIPPEEFQQTAASELGALAMGWIKDIDIIRVDRCRLQGGVSGDIKRRVFGTSDVLKLLIEKLDHKGDPHFWQLRSSNVTAELNAVKEREEMHRKELDKARERIKQLEEEVKRYNNKEVPIVREFDARGKGLGKRGKATHPLSLTASDSVARYPSVEAKTSSMNVLMRSETGGVVRRPPLKEISSPIPERRVVVDNKRALSLEINKQIEQLIRLREEIEGSQDTPSSGMDAGLPQRAPPKWASPRINVLENIQLVPPPPRSDAVATGMESPAGDATNAKEWVTERVTGKRANKKKRNKKKSEQPLQQQQGVRSRFASSSNSMAGIRSKDGNGQVKESGSKGGIEGRKESRRRPPKTAAVVIKGRSEEFSYVDALKRAREKISFRDLSIQQSRIRNSANGGILIDVPRREGPENADKLMGKLRELLNKEAFIYRPTIKGELRVSGFHFSIPVE